MKFQNSKTQKCTRKSIRYRHCRKNIKSKLELASFCALHRTTDTSRHEKALVTANEDCAVVLRSSKHGDGRLVLANTRRPWHGVPGCVCSDNNLTTACRSIVCGHAALPHIDCVQSWYPDCAVVQSAFSETAQGGDCPVAMPPNQSIEWCFTKN